MQPIAKDGHMESAVFLAVTRRMACAACVAEGRGLADAVPHHWPPKGMGGGLIDDTRVIPLCTIDHRRAHGETVVVDGARFLPLERVWQDHQVLVTLRRFFDRASAVERQQLERDLQRRDERRVWHVPV